MKDRRMMMSLFLLSFILIYGGTHLYFFIKVKTAISPGSLSSFFLGLFLLLMVLTPVMVRVLEKQGMEAFARFAAYTGYLWMGFLFLFFSASLALDIYHGLLHGAGILFRQDFSALFPANRTALILSLAWAVTTALYGYFEARDIRIERVVISTPKISSDVGKLTIVQISDVHLGLIVRQERLKRIIARINEASPDILVSTGDLVDGLINRMTGLAELMQDIRPRFGKFAVIGNHEIYAGLDQAVGFIERAGFKVLRNEGSTAGGLINVVGVNDPTIERVTHSRPAPEKTLLSKASPDRFTLLLKHRPDMDQESLGLFDLQLSGHVHKGQIFPFNLLTHLFYPVRTGFSQYPQNSALYVSRGTGTWGPPIRFLAPPEVTVIELRHMDKKK
ncbi:MAG: metallophosphoesterase [Desulfatirhabdiaceae bacterium]|nr:metallophosphoesterase [Desulfatirhabdiaceae bacterium]